MEENMIDNARVMGDYLLEGLKQFDHPQIHEVRGRGLFCAMEFKEHRSGAKFSKAMVANGVLCRDTHDTIIRLAPPLTVQKEQIDQALETMDKVLKTVF